MTTSSVQPLRFIGLDVHKHYVVIGAVDAPQQVVLRPRKLSLPEFERWQPQHLQATDAVALEATGSAWPLYDQLAASGAAVRVANPLLVKWIGAAPVKTDAHDTLKLARLLAAGLLPTVWVPPEAVRTLRTLVGQRQRLLRQRTQARNRLHSLLQRHRLLPPPGDPFALSQRTWWQSLDLPPAAGPGRGGPAQAKHLRTLGQPDTLSGAADRHRPDDRHDPAGRQRRYCPL